MAKDNVTSAIVNNVLRLAAISSLTVTALLAPNAIQLFDKPLQRYFNKLDARERQRDLRRVLSYMKYEKLITNNYEHGLVLTPKAKKRLQKIMFDEICIPQPKSWDKHWRIIFFDIPESQKSSRDAFAAKMRQLGFKVLQRSVFVHPFPCKDQVIKVAQYYHVRKYVSYIEAGHIDNQSALIRRFKHLLN